MHIALADFLTDLVQNALEAGASLVIAELAEEPDGWELSVADNGKGMDAATRQRAEDPFYTEPGKHPGRRVGLGLPFLRQAVDQCGGRLDIHSEPGLGTSVLARFPAHPDTPPPGDWAGAVAGLMAMAGTHELVATRRRGAAGYTVSRLALAEALGELESAASLDLAARYCREQDETLGEAAPERGAAGNERNGIWRS